MFKNVLKAPAILPIAASVLLAAALVPACKNPRIMPINLPGAMVSAARPDTVLRISARTVTDTITMEAIRFTVLDTVPCPPGLTRDSLVYRARVVTLPPKVILVPRYVHDTLRTIINAPGRTLMLEVPSKRPLVAFAHFLGFIFAALCLFAFLMKKEHRL